MLIRTLSPPGHPRPSVLPLSVALHSPNSQYFLIILDLEYQLRSRGAQAVLPVARALCPYPVFQQELGERNLECPPHPNRHHRLEKVNF